MQIETATSSGPLRRKDILEPRRDIEPTDENAELGWLLSRQVQEPILWPRVFPGL